MFCRFGLDYVELDTFRCGCEIAWLDRIYKLWMLVNCGRGLTWVTWKVEQTLYMDFCCRNDCIRQIVIRLISQFKY